jgi:uncharacterized protein (TIRG00374 family)
VVCLILVGLGLAAGILPGTKNLALTLIPAAVAALAIVGALLAGHVAARLRTRLERREGDQPSRKLRAAMDGLTAIAEGVDETLGFLREGNPILILGLIAYLGFDLMILWASFRAFGAEPPLAIICIAYLIGELGGLIPIPGGFGGVEAGLVGALVLYGVSLAPATAAVLAYRAIALWVPALLGAIAFVALRRTLRNEADKIAVCAPETEMDVIGRGRVVIGSPT